MDTSAWRDPASRNPAALDLPAANEPIDGAVPLRGPRRTPGNSPACGSGRLVVVSNRVARPDEPSSGGLAVAMDAALRVHGGLWFGWSGRISTACAAHIERRGAIGYATVDLSLAEHQAYYEQFSNRTLWPLLHSRPSLVDFDSRAFEGYLDVNRRFAATLQHLLRADDTVWVHDYHLIPLGAMLRRLGVHNRIGFFLHTPLPPEELLASLPRHRELFGAFAAYDLVGFQTERDLRAFRHYCVDELAAAPGKSVLTVGGRRVVVAAFPIGIDVDAIAKLAARAATTAEHAQFLGSFGDGKFAIGVDRLDYSKGLRGRIDAFGDMLAAHPDLLGHVSLLQITPFSRSTLKEYRTLRRAVEAATGAINGRFARPDWVPMRYVNASYPHEALAGYYRAARVGLVTPWRDGMNLVAKEYVAAQDPDNPGVLVLSDTAGAACELSAALLVNPFDREGLARAIHTAFTMSLAERQCRWRRMMKAISANDIHAWREGFLGALRGASASLIAHA